MPETTKENNKENVIKNFQKKKKNFLFGQVKTSNNITSKASKRKKTINKADNAFNCVFKINKLSLI